jgi:predicted MFS family arabinose efflux permease
MAAAKDSRRHGLLRVMLIAGGLLVAAQMHRMGGGVIAADLGVRFGFSGAEVGLIMGAMFFASALGQIPTGLAFDRFGPRLTVAASTLVGIAGTLLLAQSRSLPGLFLGRFLIGLSFAGVVTAILLLTMRWVAAERFSTVAARVLALANITGAFIATVPLAEALSRFGWQATFLAVALGTAVVWALIVGFLRDAPGPQARVRSGETLPESVRAFWRLLADADLRPALVMGFCAIAPFICVGGLWAGPYLRQVHGLSETGMSWVLLSMMLLLNLSTLAYGPLDRALNTRKMVVLAGAALTAAALLALALVPSPGFWQALILLHLVALGSPFYVTLAAHCRAFAPEAQAGRVIALLNLLALIGAFAGQWITGLLVSAFADQGEGASSFSYRAAFAFVAFLVLAPALVYARAPDRPPGASSHSGPSKREP